MMKVFFLSSRIFLFSRRTSFLVSLVFLVLLELLELLDPLTSTSPYVQIRLRRAQCLRALPQVAIPLVRVSLPPFARCVRHR